MWRAPVRHVEAAEVRSQFLYEGQHHQQQSKQKHVRKKSFKMPLDCLASLRQVASSPITNL